MIITRLKWLLSELQRRQVTRVAVSYIIASWILLQVAATLENAMMLPPWFDTFVLSLIAIAFPLTLVGAWMFELTPEGIRRTVGFGNGKPKKTSVTDWILVAMLMAVGGAAAIMTFTNRVAPLSLAERSIAVLPFENRSVNKADAEYGDWLSELISGLLGKANELRVISQTSSSAFKGQAVALPDIAKQLGVTFIVEGSVRTRGDDIVISAQLINAGTDTQLWAESYQRNDANALGVQSELAAQVAREIANALSVTISKREQLALNPTKNAKAFVAYQSALKLYRTATEANVRSAQRLLSDAVEQDPNFALAWALLARVHSYLYFNKTDATTGRKNAAEQALKEAMQRDADLAEVLLANAYLQYWVKRDFEGARVSFEKLSTKWPNNADVLTALASITRRQGKWSESKVYFERAIAIDPLQPARRLKAAELLLATGDFMGALKNIDASLQIWDVGPDSFPFIAKKTAVYQAMGRLEDADKLLKGFGPQPDGDLMAPYVNQAIFRRDPEVAIKLIQNLLKRDEVEGSVGRASVDLNIYLGQLFRLKDDVKSSRAHFKEAIDELRLELAKQPENADVHSYLALAYCGLNDRALAMKYATLAVATVPVEKDALSGAYYLEVQARVWSLLGDRDKAIPAITALMNKPSPSPLTQSILRVDPEFDKLRSDPRFKLLVAEKPEGTNP